MLILQNVSCVHPNKDILFHSLHLTINSGGKYALIGNNGIGKSTLLKMISGISSPAAGTITADTQAYYIPQVFGQYNHLTIAQALNIEKKYHALREILNGKVSEDNFNLLDDDWTLEERCREAFAYWQLEELDLSQKMDTLSGGQKTKVFLAGVWIHQPELILLDEPSNHLDLAGRQLLYDFIQSTQATLLIVSHDRKLLSLIDTVCELTRDGIKVYGGDYEFYKQQKGIETKSLDQDIQDKEKALRKAREKERETIERQQKLDSRGKRKQEKAGVAKIMMNTLRNDAENSTAKLKGVHAEKIGGISQELKALRSLLPDLDKMQFGLTQSDLHRGKVLFSVSDVNFGYGNRMLWKENLNFQVLSGQRIALKGKNGSGKSTLIKLILGVLQPVTGSVLRSAIKSVYIDQDYSLLDGANTVYQQAEAYNRSALQEHEIKIRLTRFLFRREDWNKRCDALSGGERMRLALCCLLIDSHTPDIIILDEPTNNLDIQNVEILAAAIRSYAGTLIVVSHDEMFLEEVGVERLIAVG